MFIKPQALHRKADVDRLEEFRTRGRDLLKVKDVMDRGHRPCEIPENFQSYSNFFVFCFWHLQQIWFITVLLDLLRATLCGLRAQMTPSVFVWKFHMIFKFRFNKCFCSELPGSFWNFDSAVLPQIFGRISSTSFCILMYSISSRDWQLDSVLSVLTCMSYLESFWGSSWF